MYTCGPGDGCRLDRRIPAPVLQIGDTSRRSAGPDGPRGYTRGGSRPGPRRYTRSGSRPDRRRTLPHTAGPSVYAKWEHLEATPFSAIPDRRAQPSTPAGAVRQPRPADRNRRGGRASLQDGRSGLAMTPATSAPSTGAQVWRDRTPHGRRGVGGATPIGPADFPAAVPRVLDRCRACAQDGARRPSARPRRPRRVQGWTRDPAAGLPPGKPDLAREV